MSAKFVTKPLSTFWMPGIPATPAAFQPSTQTQRSRDSPASVDSFPEAPRLHAASRRLSAKPSRSIIVCSVASEVWVRPFDGKSKPDTDAAIAATHMLLEATDLGLGSCWLMHFDPAPIREQFRIPEGTEPEYILAIGYPAEDSHPSERHTKRKPLEDRSIRCSKPSASSMPSHRAAPQRPRKPSSTRFSTTASSGSTSAAPRPSPWC